MDKKDLDMLINKRFAEIRSIENLSKKQYAEKLGIATSIIYAIEAGNREVSKGLILQMAEFGINMNWLLTGEGEMFLKDEPAASESPPDPVGIQLIDDFKNELPDVYRVYTEWKELKESTPGDGCRLCRTVNRLDNTRQTKMEGYADAMLAEQEEEKAAAAEEEPAAG